MATVARLMGAGRTVIASERRCFACRMEFRELERVRHYGRSIVNSMSSNPRSGRRHSLQW